MRLREKNKGKHNSSEQGAAQVWPALLASTTTTVAIFLPVFFLKDVEGQLFGDLALTIAIAVSVSLLVAVILLPVLAKFLIQENKTQDPNKHLWQKMAHKVIQLTSTNKRRLSLAAVLIITPIFITWIATPQMDYLPPVKRGRR